MSVNDYDHELHEAIQDLLDEGLIEKGTPSYGISQKVIDEGYDCLSSKQRFVYDTVVAPALQKRGEQIEVIQRINSMPD